MVSRREIIRVVLTSIFNGGKRKVCRLKNMQFTQKEAYHYDLIFAASVLIVYPEDQVSKYIWNSVQAMI